MHRLQRVFIKVVAAAGFVVVFSIANASEAQAATLTVSNDCTIPEAIQAINAAADADGCTATGSYGSSDTITIPAGTYTLTADAPQFDKSVIVNGAGSSATTIDFGGNSGFSDSVGDVPLTANFTVAGVRLTNAVDAGIYSRLAASYTVQDVIIDNSFKGLSLNNIKQVIIENCVIQNNAVTDNSESGSGIGVYLSGLVESDIPSVRITGTKVLSNSTTNTIGAAGINITITESTATDADADGTKVSGMDIDLQHVTIMGNQSKRLAGLIISGENGPTSTVPMDLTVDASTIANNSVLGTVAVVLQGGDVSVPAVAGAMVSGRLSERQNFTNVTVANNTVSLPANDNNVAVAGFYGLANKDSATLRIVSTTVAGNTVTQPSGDAKFGAFAVVIADITIGQDLTVVINGVSNGSTAENSLVAHNLYNGETYGCLNEFNMSKFGYNTSLDATPANAGHNMADDQRCTGYTFVPNIWDTIAHAVADNGGPVPTIALLEGSPAIDGGGQVQGITTDARGVVRSGYYSVGAYQGNLLAATTNAASQLARTGLYIALASPFGVLLIVAAAYTYLDYRRHKQPLLQADPNARYSYFHHLKVVSIPLIRYRLSVSVDKQLGEQSDEITRY